MTAQQEQNYAEITCDHGDLHEKVLRPDGSQVIALIQAVQEHKGRYPGHEVTFFSPASKDKVILAKSG